jgi:hypothetical protein
MTRTELIIQLLKVAIGIAFGAYFVWWSLQVLDRLTPEYEAAGAMIGLFSSSNAPPCRGVMDVNPGFRDTTSVADPGLRPDSGP